MFAIQKSKSHKGKCTPNVLPCRIQHNGAVNTSKRYWNPTTTPDGKTVAYFRGRKLHGKQLRVPKGYRGLVLASTDRILPIVAQSPKDGDRDNEDDEDGEDVPEVQVVEEMSEFDNIMIWGHEALADETDPYMKGVEEWVSFAERIHSNGEEEQKDQ